MTSFGFGPMGIYRTNRVVSFGLLALLLVAAAAGSVWHHHNHSSEFSCQACHLGHQAAETPQVGQRILAAELVESLSSSQDPIVRSGPVFRRTPSRAPPSA
jgi:hypothetical protein